MGRNRGSDGTRRHASAAAVGGGKPPGGIAARERATHRRDRRRAAAARPAGRRGPPMTTQSYTRVAVRLLRHGARRSERREDEKRHVRREKSADASSTAGRHDSREISLAPARRRSVRQSAAVSLFVDLGSCARPRRTSPRTSPPLAGPARFPRVVTDLALDMRVRFGSALAVAILAVFASFAAAANLVLLLEHGDARDAVGGPRVPVGHEDPKTGKTFYVDDSGESVWEYPGVWRGGEQRARGPGVLLQQGDRGVRVGAARGARVEARQGGPVRAVSARGERERGERRGWNARGRTRGKRGDSLERRRRRCR